MVAHVSQIDPDPFPGFPELAGTHTDVLIFGRLLDLSTNQNPHAGLPSSQKAVFQVFVICLPSHPTHR